MLVLNHSEAHKFVRDSRRRGVDVRWDGWTMVFWKPTHHGFTNVRGAYRNGRWGMESRVPVGDDGLWKVPGKNAKPV